jgi:hypothetical protein
LERANNTFSKDGERREDVGRSQVLDTYNLCRPGERDSTCVRNVRNDIFAFCVLSQYLEEQQQYFWQQLQQSLP